MRLVIANSALQALLAIYHLISNAHSSLLLKIIYCILFSCQLTTRIKKMNSVYFAENCLKLCNEPWKKGKNDSNAYSSPDIIRWQRYETRPLVELHFLELALLLKGTVDDWTHKMWNSVNALETSVIISELKTCMEFTYPKG